MIARIGAALLALLAAWPAPGRTQEAYPSRPIRLIVPFATGGPSDIIARLMTPKMTEVLGQAVVVEARPGAGGVTGVDVMAKSPPDGYTIALGSAGGLVISPGLDRNMPYDTLRDIAPVTLAAIVPEPVVVGGNQPFHSMQELIAAAKAAPGRLNYGSTGPGSMPHLAGEWIKSAAGMDITHVPYRGGAPLTTALLAGEVQIGLADLPILMPHLRAGAIRALAIGHESRVPWLPDVPTMREAGLPEVNTDNWHGLVAPARTPEPILARLHDAAVAALKDPQVARLMFDQGALPGGNSRDEFAAVIRSEMERWGDVIRRANIRVD
jgi:tripartite-type tricarboxylate transporter receptor subunit TctC